MANMKGLFVGTAMALTSALGFGAYATNLPPAPGEPTVNSAGKAHSAVDPTIPQMVNRVYQQAKKTFG